MTHVEVVMVANEAGGEWAEVRRALLDTPEPRDEYERTKLAVLRTRRLLQRMDTERERLGLSKAELAERIGTDPSVVRRLFSSSRGNPTLKTVMEVAEALGMDLELQVAEPWESLRGRTVVTERKTGKGAAA